MACFGGAGVEIYLRLVSNFAEFASVWHFGLRDAGTDGPAGIVGFRFCWASGSWSAGERRKGGNFLQEVNVDKGNRTSQARQTPHRHSASVN